MDHEVYWASSSIYDFFAAVRTVFTLDTVAARAMANSSNNPSSPNGSARRSWNRLTSRSHDVNGPAEETVYRVGDLELDRLSHRVVRGKEELTLQPREFRLLEYLMKHAGQVVTRTMLLENVWDYHFDPQTNVIDVHISRLRSKIDKGFERPLLHTIRGAGYMIRDGAR